VYAPVRQIHETHSAVYQRFASNANAFHYFTGEVVSERAGTISLVNYSKFGSPRLNNGKYNSNERGVTIIIYNVGSLKDFIDMHPILDEGNRLKLSNKYSWRGIWCSDVGQERSPLFFRYILTWK
jgi:hypothetical protein